MIQAQLCGKNYLGAEELLDEALSCYENDSGRAAEAMLALGELFKVCCLFGRRMWKKIDRYGLIETKIGNTKQHVCRGNVSKVVGCY